MVEKDVTEKSAYDYVIKGKEVPPEVIEATLARQQELKTILAKHHMNNIWSVLKIKYIFHGPRTTRLPVMPGREWKGVFR
jgi:hypothetical protein